MKLSFGILFLAVFAYSSSKVSGGQFECYKCSGDDCEGTSALVNCYTDSPIVQTTPTTVKITPTTTPVKTTPTTVGITHSSTTPVGTTPTTVGITHSTTPPIPPLSPTTNAETTPMPTEETTPGIEIAGESKSPSNLLTADILLNKYRALSRKRRAADENYACYTLHYKDGDKTKTQKGCALTKATENPCDSFTAPAATFLIEYKTCLEPQCNSSTKMHLSLAAIVIGIYVRFFI